jgi:hypothetical protein
LPPAKLCAGRCYDNEPEAGCRSSGCEPCNLPNAAAACDDAGFCVIAACYAGFADCDQSELNHHATGCETNVALDPKNCGSCGQDCFAADPGKNWQCLGETCSVECGGWGRLDCDGDGICETGATTTDNCGFCGNACNLPNAVSSCCARSSDPEKNCFADPNDPTLPGECRIERCDPAHFLDCDGIAINGCEVNSLNDTAHCGACNSPCRTTISDAYPICSGGICDVDCKAPLVRCGDQCADPSTNLQHCGGCNRPCTAPAMGTPLCSGGACDFACNAGWTKCGVLCVNTQTDGTNCGGCGITCSGGKVCSNKQCICPGGTADCSGACYNLSTTREHCGVCNNNCSTHPNVAAAICANGTCNYSCAGGFRDCMASVGCETSITTNTNCGSCGNTCGGGRNCVNGSCICTGGQIECGGVCIACNAPNVCCGGTCQDCSGGRTCQSGVCQCPSGQRFCTGSQQCRQCCVDSDCTGAQACCGGVCKTTC